MVDLLSKSTTAVDSDAVGNTGAGTGTRVLRCAFCELIDQTIARILAIGHSMMECEIQRIVISDQIPVMLRAMPVDDHMSNQVFLSKGRSVRECAEILVSLLKVMIDVQHKILKPTVE